MNYFGLPPHRQLKLGLGLALLVGLVGPYIAAILEIGYAAGSLGRPAGAFQLLLAVGIYGTIVLTFALGLVLPVVRILSISHQYAKAYGRGDEHTVFYIGLCLLVIGIVLNRLLLTTLSKNPQAWLIVLSLGGLATGLLVLVVGIALLYRLSERVYVANAQRTNMVR